MEEFYNYLTFISLSFVFGYYIVNKRKIKNDFKIKFNNLNKSLFNLNNINYSSINSNQYNNSISYDQCIQDKNSLDDILPYSDEKELEIEIKVRSDNNSPNPQISDDENSSSSDDGFVYITDELVEN